MKGPSPEHILFSFDDPTAAVFRPIDDVVMGGASRSEVAPTARGILRFAGVVSLANGGGFASIRAPIPRASLAGSRGLALHTRGDGKAYKVNVKLDTAFDGVLYQARWQPAVGGWSTVELAWTAFEPRFRGQLLPGAPAIDPTSIAQLGLMIADRQAGPFALDVAWIAALPAVR